MTTPSQMLSERAASSQKLGLRMKRDRGLARTQWERQRLGAERGHQLGQFNYEQDQFRERLPGQFIGRGLQNSGIRNRGFQDYAAQRLSGLQGLNLQFARQQGELGQTQQDIWANYNAGVKNIDAESFARRASIASMLRGYV